MGLLDKLFGKKQSPAQEAIVDTQVEVKTEVKKKEQSTEVGVPADGDQVVRGE